jgi:hypothetical protein
MSDLLGSSMLHVEQEVPKNLQNVVVGVGSEATFYKRAPEENKKSSKSIGISGSGKQPMLK